MEIRIGIIYGLRVSLVVGVVSACLAMIFGVIMGLIAGYARGFWEAFIMRAVDVQLSLPTIMVALCFMVMFGKGLWRKDERNRPDYRKNRREQRRGDHAVKSAGFRGHGGSSGKQLRKVRGHRQRLSQGVAVHSSRAQDGINAIEKMAKIVLALQAHGRALRDRSTSIPAPPSTGRKFVYPTTNVGTIRGGLKENIVPDYCAITFNRRVTPEESLEGARAEYLSVVEQAVADDPQAKWRYEEMNTREPSLTRLDDPFIARFQQVAEDILGREIPVYGGLGGNDACFMRNRLKIPVVQFGAAREDSKAHGTDEHIGIDDLLNASKVYAAMIMEMLGSG